MLFPGEARAESPALSFSISSSLSMPLIGFDNGVANTGVLYELETRLAKYLNRKMRLVSLPRPRIYKLLDRGKIDVHCYASKDWIANNTQYAWSVPIMVQRDFLITRASNARIKAPPHGALVGTVNGYIYTSLASSFATGQLVRDDARTQEQVINKLEMRRYDYAITNEISFNWYKRINDARDQFQKLQMIQQSEIRCMVRKGPEVPTQEILSAIKTMMTNGEIGEIIAQYR
ncbi:substrate-binding periplasmic protein [Pseudomonas sp.]|uniref:substrate-binding periplasmic protein n=1 Tax=Pseudomonas sp. TaxID=306 RepID=UPI003A9801FC